ncbi:MAG TPA: hypothetical protein VN851_18480 [Thermoanaerobaculia bacterium]|nr:hypothetical protein [Thermoanaerobaculia bacterium]
MKSTDIWPLVMLWMLWLMAALQCALAVNGWRVERREGLRISRLRLGAAIVIFLTATVLAVPLAFFSSPPSLQPPQTEPSPRSTRIAPQPNEAALRQRLDQNRRKLEQIERVRQHLIAESTDLQKRLGGESEKPEPRVPASRQTPIGRTAATMMLLLLIGSILLTVGGPVQTLFPTRGRREDKALLDRDLIRLTTAVWQKYYKNGLEIAEEIPEQKLTPFDRLDFLFLRAYCRVQIFASSSKENVAGHLRSLVDGAIRDLEAVVDEAPRRGEAVYLLALAQGYAGKAAESLQLFERAAPLLANVEKSILQNQSVCLLQLAERSLSEGNTEQAEIYFARVTSLGSLADSVVHSRLRIGLIDLRKAINQENFTAATALLEKLTALADPTGEQKAQLEVVGSALNARVALRSDDTERALAEAEAFLSRYWPTDLLPPDDDTADETFSPLLDGDLPFPREVFRGFLFIQAVALCRSRTRGKAILSEVEVAALSEPLLRALQIDPRQRDLLAALGGLYYWFRKDKRRQALDWLEAASLMGVSGRIVRKILEEDRLLEMERREVLDWFRSASSRFLRDPSLASEVRRALVEELGRFQEFEPMLIELETKPDFEPEEPTLEVIRERAGYLSRLVAEVSQQAPQERGVRLAQIQSEYAGCLATLERTTACISLLERRVFSELANTIAI